MTVITIGDNEWGGNALRNTWGGTVPNVAPNGRKVNKPLPLVFFSF